MTERICKKCGAPQQRNNSGQWRCPPCQKEYYRTYYQKNKERRLRQDKEWRKANKDKVKAARKRKYWKNPEKARRAAERWNRENHERHLEIQRACYARNRAKANAASRAWREANRDRARQTNKEWWKANKGRWQVYKQNRRARERQDGGKLSSTLTRDLMKRQRSKCVACGDQLKRGWRHLDHIMPLARGGKHEDANMQLLCPPCNLSKNARDPIEFMQEKGFLL